MSATTPSLKTGALPTQKLRHSKKAIVLGVALLNLNIIFFISSHFKYDLQTTMQMMTAILFLVGIYTGVQGGVDMIQSSKLDVLKSDTTETKIEKKYEFKMNYVDSPK